ncbi:hypothetical protein M6D93_01605 [Jatrophihabitans telluris]|uniref:Uncharacterized protein n=1 Tax=Jatrophihabitans telluris TaxID=2038343 RepID=A0ABY4R0R2_9ACTN|nr:hypothetical protein [Jatrophihabitans telluris]UQX88711.1 hypothetical protein M6D93_01605 [Jatrophihabitans telluris]
MTDTAPTPTKGGPPPITPGPNGTITPTLGEINATDIDPYIAKAITPTNGWGLHCTDFDYYLVAGAHDGQGELIAAQVDPVEGDVGSPITLAAPAGSGALQIQSASCAAVVLTAADGTTLTYVPGQTAFQ